MQNAMNRASKIHVVILVGAPGSGKTTWAKDYERAEAAKGLDGRNVHRVSADGYFERDGVYAFDPSLLDEAHSCCMRQFAAALNALAFVPHWPVTLVVDNTNTTLVEIAPYYLMARAYSATVEVVRFEANWRVCAARNVHGVSEGSVYDACRRADELALPTFWNVTERTIIDYESFGHERPEELPAEA